MLGYIYIRENEWYLQKNIVKMGRTENLKNRDRDYITGEPERGEMTEVYNIKDFPIDLVEKLLQEKLKQFHYKATGGVEFYNKQIKAEVEPILKELKIDYRKLSKQEINELLTEQKEKRENTEKLPRDYQTEIIVKSFNHFKCKDKGILNLCCGAGKTLTSLWIAERMGFKKILIAVPSDNLRNQWEKDIKSLTYFKDYKILKIKEKIKDNFFNSDKYIVIVCYNSSLKVFQKNLTFDFKILDEVHHVTKDDKKTESKTFFKVLNINSVKTVSLTATLKVFEDRDKTIDESNPDFNQVSNLNKHYFGDVIYTLTLWDGINKGIVCDYEIITVISESIEKYLNSDEILGENKNLAISTITTLKILKSKNINRVLFYVNGIEKSKTVIEYIKKVKSFFNIENLFFDEYNSEKSYCERQKNLKNFIESEKGILINAYCLGEGTDLPNLEAVVIGDSMDSDIRIYQSCLRPCRKDLNNPEKIGSIIIPCADIDDRFETVNNVVSRFSNEDPEVFGKIKVYNLEKGKHSKTPNKKGLTETFDLDEKLSEEIQIRVKKRQNKDISFSKLKKEVKKEGIKSKTDYLNFAKQKGYPEDIETDFKSFSTWSDFLGIDDMLYYDLETCKTKIREYIRNQPNILDKTDLNRTLIKINILDPKIPDPSLIKGVYNTDLIHIINVSKKKN